MQQADGKEKIRDLRMTPKAPSKECLEGALGEGTVLNMGTAVVLAYVV